MQTVFEQFAVTSMLGHEDSPPRLEGKLCFSQAWEQQAFGIALALSKSGYFDWEDFRQQLIVAIAEWESTHPLDDDSWDYYECWLTALELVVAASGLTAPEELTAVSCSDTAS
jgi:nitrile hydratase accessory protein